MKQKAVPMRQCKGCRERKPKKELMRIVRTPENNVVIDITGKINGRGMYICRNTQCLMKAEKKKALEQSFGIAVSSEIYEKLKKEMALIGQE